MDLKSTVSSKGYLSFILHAHLPFINHPEYEYFFEESWLFQAITDCYIPLLQSFERLEKENIQYQLTFSISPTLIAMLQNQGLQARYKRHLNSLIHLANDEINFKQNPEEQKSLAQFYKEKLESCLQYYTKNKHDLLALFVRLHKKKHLELITTAATHAVLPIYQAIPEAILAQLKTGRDLFVKATGIKPKGVWLPECAYCEGLESYIKKAGYEYCILENTSVYFASPNIDKNVYRRIKLPNGVHAVTRDPQSSHQVWSAESGYPGDIDYREYHKDLCDDSESPHVLNYLNYFGHRCPSGFKYWRIQQKNGQRYFYDPNKAKSKALHHAREFILDKRNQIRNIHDEHSSFVITAPYDAELFGHWWYEGPEWLEAVLRICNSQADLKTASPSYLPESVNCPITIKPTGATWGKNSSFEHWVNPTNDWIYPKYFFAFRSFQSLLEEYADLGAKNPDLDRALKQAARSLLLAQSSDWAFMIRTGSSQEYAFKRVKDNLARYHFLEHSIRTDNIPLRKLQALEIMDDIFPDVDYKIFQKNK